MPQFHSRRATIIALLVALSTIGAGPSVAAQNTTGSPPEVASSAPASAGAKIVLGGGTEEDLDRIVLFQLRDRVFRRTAGGRRATQLFYTHLTDMAAASLADPSVFGLAQDWLLSWQGVLRSLVVGQGSSVTLTQAHIDSLSDYVEALADAGSPALREALEREQQRLDLESWAGMTLDKWLDGPVNRLSCAEVDGVLCLNQGRFRVEAEWLDSEGNGGRGQGIPLGDDSGYFWFFGPDNIELVVKVLDACFAPFDRFWVFAAGLTNVDVRLTVTDTASGSVQEYRNSLATAYRAIQDTAAFSTCSTQVSASLAPRRDSQRSRAASSAKGGLLPVNRVRDRSDRLLRVETQAPTGLIRTAQPANLAPAPTGGDSCLQPTSLCLDNQRFRVEVDWTTAEGATGRGQARSLTADSGTFWFFDPDNVELVVKVLDACDPFDRFWVFAAGLTNLEVVLRVTDTASGAVREYRNSQGTAFEAIQDVDAFRTCP